MSPLLKAIGIGVSVFAIMMLLFWGIARVAGKPFITIPRRIIPPPTPVATTPALPFLR